MKLNLGAGTEYRAGWINLDVVAWPGVPPPDLVWDARKEHLPFPDDSVDEVYLGYLLMHLSPQYQKPLLLDVHRVLAPCGFMIVSEVDFELVMARWLFDPSDSAISELIWGEQGRDHGNAYIDYDKHCWGFSRSTLRSLLERCGFCDVVEGVIQSPDVWFELTMRAKKHAG